MKKWPKKSIIIIITFIIVIITYFSYANFKNEENAILYEETQIVREGVIINNSENKKSWLEYPDIYSWYDQYGSPHTISQ